MAKKKKLDADVEKRLDELARHLRQNDNTQKVWKELFTKKQRKRIEDNKIWQKDIITMWSKVKRVGRARAIIDMAYELGWLNQPEHDRLRRGTGHASDSTAKRRIRPVYEDGLLTFDGEIIRRVKQFANPSKPQVILDAFQSKRWLRKVKNPWLGKVNEEAVYHAVSILNQNLETIVFEVINGGQRVRWSERG